MTLEVLLRADAGIDLVDADGRRVGEVASVHYDRTSTEIVRCPFHDRRRGRPMNASALQQLGASWTDVLDAARALGDGTGVGAWRAAIGLTAAPVLHRALHPGVPVPVALSAGYKAALGFAQTLTHLLLTVGEDVPFEALGTGDQLVAFLDREGWLIGQEQACAGSPRRIVDLWTALGGGPVVLPAAWAAVGLAERLDEVALIEAVRIGEVRRGGEPGRCPWLAAAVLSAG